MILEKTSRLLLTCPIAIVICCPVAGSPVTEITDTWSYADGSPATKLTPGGSVTTSVAPFSPAPLAYWGSMVNAMRRPKLMGAYCALSPSVIVACASAIEADNAVKQAQSEHT